MVITLRILYPMGVFIPLVIIFLVRVVWRRLRGK